tara:strand:- start:4492 stop:4731 length:240 start_codon:yes stop_codon:yes gene_type:complete
MEAEAWGTVSVAVNSTNRGFVSADFAAINSRVSSSWLASCKKPHRYTHCVSKRKLRPKHLPSNSNNTLKISTINSLAGD